MAELAWYRCPEKGEWEGEESSCVVAQVLHAKEGEAEGSLGAFARFLAGAKGATDLPPPSPEGWYYIATLEARGVWCRPVGPFETAVAARDACTAAWWAAKGPPEFMSTGHAYDACQTREDLPTGTIFVVPSEEIVGISWAWPITVSGKIGRLHTAGSDPRDWPEDEQNEALNKALPEAIALSKKLGFGVYTTLRAD